MEPPGRNIGKPSPVPRKRELAGSGAQRCWGVWVIEKEGRQPEMEIKAVHHNLITV